MGEAAKLDLTFTERLRHLVDTVHCKRIDSPEDQEAVYRLRHDAYVREGNIQPNASGLLHDDFDEAPNTWTFGFYIDGELASSIRINVASKVPPPRS